MVFFSLALLLYGALRLIAWHNTVLLDDTDSIVYLSSIDAYHTLEWDTINRIDADSTPFYPALGAAAKIITGDTEPAARLVSFVFSLILVIAAFLLTRGLDGNLSAVFAMIILAFNGPMISLSVSVLTETSYLGTIYAGFYLLWRQLRRETIGLGGAAALGLVFGLAFLNRTEGILYVAAIPIAIVGLGWIFREREKRPPVSRVIGFSAVYVVLFLALAVPQILHVSSKMGTPALNGRVAWNALVTALPDRSLNEQMFGLDFDEEQINILYIRANYAEALDKARATGNSSLGIVGRVKQSINNMDTIYRDFIGHQITPFGFALAFMGLVSLYVNGAFFGLLYCFFLLALLLAGPIAHTSVIPRHLAAAIPLLCVLQGIGLRGVATLLERRVGGFSLPRAIVIPGLLVILLAGSVFPLNAALRPPDVSVEYDPGFLAAPVELIETDPRTSAVSAQRAQIGYYSNRPFVYAPYTTYEKLLHYLDANKVSHFYVDFEHMADFPYIGRFDAAGGYQDDFERLWVGTRSGKPPAALFRRRVP